MVSIVVVAVLVFAKVVMIVMNPFRRCLNYIMNLVNFVLLLIIISLVALI
jgi:hypothetical protein